MNSARIAYLFMATFLSAGQLSAADFSDPTWPCIQRKVETLSLGIMWPHPVPESTPQESISEAGVTLSTKLALRRVSLEEAETLVTEFANSHPDLTTDDLGLVFRNVFDRIGKERSTIIKGISRYSLKQIALSQAIDETRVTMSNLMKADAPDFDEVDRLEEKLDWDERIFRDRAKSLTYVCETPVLLEKRVYAIAQILLRHVPE